MTMRFFDAEPKPGMPVRHPTFFRAIVRLVRALERMTVADGHVDWSDGAPTLVFDGASAAASGRWADDYVVVGGKKLDIPENTNGYDFLKVYLDGVTEPEWVETMPETHGEDFEVYDMTAQHIHLPGNFGGG